MNRRPLSAPEVEATPQSLRAKADARTCSAVRRVPWLAGLLLLAVLIPCSRAAESSDWRAWALDAESKSTVVAQPLWFRAWVRVPDAMAGMSGPDLWRDSMSITLRGQPGPVTVSLNGRVIAEVHDIPAETSRRLKIPRGAFEKGRFNALVLRLDGSQAKRGLVAAPVIAGYFDELHLGPAWEFTDREPAVAEVLPRADAPSRAAYVEAGFRPGTSVMAASAEPVRGQYVSPEDALRRLQVESDLVVEEMLHEPEVAQPTQFSFDERGRLWVAQYRQYPFPAGVKMISRDKYYRSKYDRVPPAPPHHDPGADVISVHEDRDGDGRFETHRQVLTGLNMANAVVTGHGGLWVMHTPYLLFYPDADRDDVPDGLPEVRLQGFGLEDTHSVANGLAWGPDGWLYGAQGSTTTSRVTRPGVDAADAPGVYVEGCMVWRYHPQRREYEIFADGSGNTFGVSFDGEGRLFTGHNGGDTRGWHHVQSGLYLKQGHDPGKFGPPPNPYAFGEMPMMRSTHPVPRFTHMTIVASGTALPERWRGRFLGADPLHHSLVAAERRVAGSTFETTDVGTPLRTDDLTFRPVYLANAPDGALYIADFREEYIAHGQNYQSQIDPFTGRIYRLRGRVETLEREVDMSRLNGASLVARLSHPNPWHRQTAVRLLSERRELGVEQELVSRLKRAELHPALEALWALHGMGRLDEALAVESLSHPEPMVRAWTLRLMGDARTLPTAFAEAALALAARELDAEVRCQVLSTARRLPVSQALPLMRAVAMRSEDRHDAFIPLMAWFVVESHVASAREAVLELFRVPAFWEAGWVREHLVPRLMRRLAASGTRAELTACAILLDLAPTPADRAALMAGFEEAMRGRPMPPMPDELTAAMERSGFLSVELRARRGDVEAVVAMRRRAVDVGAPVPQRVAAVRLLGEVRPREAMPELLELVRREGEIPLRLAACAALSGYAETVVGEELGRHLAQMPALVRDATVNLLASRASWSRELIAAVTGGRLSRAAIPVDVRARLERFDDEVIRAWLRREPRGGTAASGAWRPRIESVRRIIAEAPGDPYRGEPLYMDRCGGCHTLFFKGGKIGPDLTSYQRDDPGTLLVSVIDPNAEIREGFENHVVTTRDGRTLGGFLADQDTRVLVLRGYDGTDLTVARSEVVSLEAAGRSLMPEGLLEEMTDQEIRDLFAYLRQSQPIVR